MDRRQAGPIWSKHRTHARTYVQLGQLNLLLATDRQAEIDGNSYGQSQPDARLSPSAADAGAETTQPPQQCEKKQLLRRTIAPLIATSIATPICIYLLNLEGPHSVGGKELSILRLERCQRHTPSHARVFYLVTALRGRFQIPCLLPN